MAQLCRASLALRAQVVEALVDLTAEAVTTLRPMCRPLWWLDPEVGRGRCRFTL